ncbi:MULTISPECIES: glycosyltransferase [Vibrio]|uniref:glycosyltransferase n=1 Tax=Vibrio TaxID=662 RepID=UPI002F411EC9
MAKKILFVHYGDNWIRGSERCLLDLVKYLDDRQYHPFIWTNNQTLSRQLDIMNIDNEVNQFPLLLGWKAPRFDAANWLNLIEYGCKIIERESIDLVHVNSAAPCQWMIAAAKIKHIPLVTQLHCSYIARDRLTLGINASPHIIAVSKHAAQSLLDDGYPKSNLSVVHNGIDTQSLIDQPKVDVRKQLNIPEDDFVFATVGSLIHRKGVDRIMTALRHLTLEHPNAHLVVIGDGPLRSNLESQAELLRLAHCIHFVGEKSNVVGWLKDCDAFISGARNEAFGLVIAEASLANIPVIAPYEGGIPEFVRHGETGLLYKNVGIRSMTKAMRLVMANPKLSAYLATKGYEHIIAHHDLEVTCRAIEKVYLNLWQNKPIRSIGVLSTFLPLKAVMARRFSLLGGQHG